MTDVQQSTMRATAVAYEPPYVGDALMARLSHDDVPAGLPLLDVERVPDWRDPSTLDRSALVTALRQSYEGLGVEPPNGMLRELEARRGGDRCCRRSGSPVKITICWR